ncbi:MAG TPA: hypothetical protein VMB05_06590 [Solirubrobacteraceae bacterium]|nr:hypothetical protein [Solirubrobacteraceae bacterium]
MSLSRPTAFPKSRQTIVCIAFALLAFTFTTQSALAVQFRFPVQAPRASQVPEDSGCPSAPTSNPFARFGDNADYSEVPGGTFEPGTEDWSLSNAAVISGGESYGVAGGSHSLAIQPTGVAISPSFCVSTANPSFRLFARRTSGSWGVLNVLLRWTDANGSTHDTMVVSLQSGTSWTPSSVLPLATTLPLWQGGETLSARLVLKPEAYGGAWAVDDAFVDPRMR